MTTRPLAALAALALLAGCSPAQPSPAPATSSVAALDFTEPGVASAMVNRLMAKAESRKALMVEVTESTVEVTVPGQSQGQPVSWAYRDGELAKVVSDLQDVGQSRFTVSEYNIADVGALFRAAAGQSGSSQDQSLTIVGTENTPTGDVQMSVSTVPESRTVFFTPSGALMEVLDFDTAGGLKRGLTDAIGGRGLIYSAAVISDQGAWTEFPGTNNTTLRRTRSPKVPAITAVRSAATNTPLFSSSRVDAAAIWRVVQHVRSTGDASPGSAWSVTIDSRDQNAGPRLYFTFGFRQVVADLNGTIVSS